MNRQDISRLNHNRAIFMKFGLVISLALAILAFNWTTEQYEDSNLRIEDIHDKLDHVDVIRTAQQKPRQLPPPVVAPSDEIIPAEMPDFSNEPVTAEIDITPGFTAPVSQPAAVSAPVSYEPPPLPVVEEPAAKDDIFKIVEEMPRFGQCASLPYKEERERCSNRELLSYIYQNIRYPELARSSNIEGLVVVQFVIEKDGSISAAHILRDIGGGCGREALRVVNSMPEWTPGAQRGRPVRVQMNLPVKFSLK
ncbi:MAG: energy transducer TonB [Lewinellaceae bacterium]|nr:energy transducer TonB [Lewinellaceae bacterium]